MVAICTCNIPRATCPYATLINNVLHGLANNWMLSHSKVVVATPCDHFVNFFVVFIEKFCIWVPAFLPLKVCEYAVSSFTLYLVDSLAKNSSQSAWSKALSGLLPCNPCATRDTSKSTSVFSGRFLTNLFTTSSEKSLYFSLSFPLPLCLPGTGTHERRLPANRIAKEMGIACCHPETPLSAVHSRYCWHCYFAAPASRRCQKHVWNPSKSA